MQIKQVNFIPVLGLNNTFSFILRSSQSELLGFPSSTPEPQFSFEYNFKIGLSARKVNVVLTSLLL